MAPYNPERRARKRRGAAFLTSFIVMSLVGVAGITYLNQATHTLRTGHRQTQEVQTTHLCEAGVQEVLRSLWRPFKVNQNFAHLELSTAGASPSTPTATVFGEIQGVGKYSAGVIERFMPAGDTYSRVVRVRAVGWIDSNNNNVVDDGEGHKTVEVTAVYQLARSQVFDYTYFVNNYGWMDGFGVNDLLVQGDMRANANFDFLNGSPTVNGMVVASRNDKLQSRGEGRVNMAPVKWNESTYRTEAARNDQNPDHNQRRWRQGYDPAVHGARGSSQYAEWRDLIFDSVGNITANRVTGAAIGDRDGWRGWERTTVGATPTWNVLDSLPTEEVIMPDLSDLDHYINMSQSWRNPIQTWMDGTTNPNFNQGAWVEVWDTTLNGGAGGYRRLDTNGVVNGSGVLVGTATRPIRLHGPVTFTQDVVIKGHVTGQGTLYAGRNVHVVGSVRYVNPPNFRRESGRNTARQIEEFNQKRDMLGLAARGSVMMGNTTSFSHPWPLQFMTPPYTRGRWDENGNWIPPFDAMQIDSTGRRRFQPAALTDAQMSAIAENVNQIDAIMYTNFVGGGNIGGGGGGFTINGSIIGRDEAMVVWSLPARLNYDLRIRERTLTNNPLIDLQLPRSPVMLRSAWQDRGFKTVLQ